MQGVPQFSDWMAQRYGGMYGSSDVTPRWAQPTGFGYPNAPVLGNTAPMGIFPNAAPPPVPTAEGAKAPPPPPKMPNPGVSAMNPIAGGDMFGSDVRKPIFRQLYRTGKQVGGAAGEALMNVGKPTIPEADPFAKPPAEEPPRPMVAPPPSAAPPPRDQWPAHLRTQEMAQDQPKQMGSPRMQRLMSRVRGQAPMSDPRMMRGRGA